MRATIDKPINGAEFKTEEILIHITVLFLIKETF